MNHGHKTDFFCLIHVLCKILSKVISHGLGHGVLFFILMFLYMICVRCLMSGKMHVRWVPVMLLDLPSTFLSQSLSFLSSISKASNISTLTFWSVPTSSNKKWQSRKSSLGSLHGCWWSIGTAVQTGQTLVQLTLPKCRFDFTIV